MGNYELHLGNEREKKNQRTGARAEKETNCYGLCLKKEGDRLFAKASLGRQKKGFLGVSLGFFAVLTSNCG